MPTNDERRQIAERLRSTGHDCLDSGGLLSTLKRLLGVVTGSWRDVLLRLADLIEPEERTCHNTCKHAEKGQIICSECGCHSETWFETPHGDRYAEVPNYCPNCGAEVVDV